MEDWRSSAGMAVSCAFDIDVVAVVCSICFVNFSTLCSSSLIRLPQFEVVSWATEETREFFCLGKTHLRSIAFCCFSEGSDTSHTRPAATHDEH